MNLILNPARLAVLVLVSLLVFGSCSKDISAGDADSQEEFASQASSEADAEADDIFNEVFDNVMGVNTDVGFGGTGVFGRMNTSGSFDISTARVNACPDVTVTHLSATDPFPVKIVMDFGTGCVARDLRTRSGKIIVTYSNRLFVLGAVATTTFDNYKVDSIQIQGTHTITNIGEIISANCVRHKWKVVVENAKLTKPNGNYTEWRSTKTITQQDGMCTPYIHIDDVYKIEGSGVGKVKRGDLLIAWNSEITDSLIKRFNCHWLVQGTIRVMRLNLATNSPWVAAIDYGNGDCDNNARASINGVIHNITLP